MLRAFLTLFAASSLLAEEERGPLPRAHAHNDYQHSRPLLDALDHGFCSVEADIFLTEGELRVGHFRWQLRKGRTLESLYLAPLAKRVRANNGSVYPQKERFILLVDIKGNGAEVYPVLDKLLERYAGILTGYENDTRTERAVTVILSGGSPRGLAAKDPTRYCAIDGRPPDLGSKAPVHLVPLVSSSWRDHFQWRGRGGFPDADRKVLRELVARAHNDGRLLRFWAVPDNEKAWEVLHAAGVDLINTDKLAALARFLRKPPPE